MNISEKFFRRFIIKAWPTGGYVFLVNRNIDFYSIDAVQYMPGVGNIGSMVWVSDMKDALDIISKYPNDIKIDISVRELFEFFKEVGNHDFLI